MHMTECTESTQPPRTTPAQPPHNPPIAPHNPPHNRRVGGWAGGRAGYIFHFWIAGPKAVKSDNQEITIWSILWPRARHGPNGSSAITR